MCVYSVPICFLLNETIWRANIMLNKNFHFARLSPVQICHLKPQRQNCSGAPIGRTAASLKGNLKLRKLKHCKWEVGSLSACAQPHTLCCPYRSPWYFPPCTSLLPAGSNPSLFLLLLLRVEKQATNACRHV